MTSSNLSARELILALLDSSAETSLKASYLVAAGELFSIDAGAIRVALARLVKDRSLTQVTRGAYGRGSRAGVLHHLVRNWATVEQGLRPWRGNWLGIYLAHLGRTDRTRVRKRERALRLLGFASADAALWVRPANLLDSLTTLHTRLIELGLDSTAVLLDIGSLVPAETLNPSMLWPRQTLEDSYRQHSAMLVESGHRLGGLDERDAARETLVAGREVTRHILLDPLLPEQLVDVGLRREMINQMIAYDRAGKRLWRNFFRRHQRALE